MKEWKIRQEIFHRLNTDHNDDLSLHTVEIKDDIVENAIKYFTTTELGWVYPAKSYVVAICYARWLNQYFNEDFYECLNDPDLLYNNDPYYIPYEQDKDTYNKILTAVGFDFDETAGVTPDIKTYFLKEFDLDK